MGTIALKGKAYAKVTNIGMNTEMGKIANMLQDIDEDKSPLKRKIGRTWEGFSCYMLVNMCCSYCYWYSKRTICYRYVF